jgi:hypothetical protein
VKFDSVGAGHRPDGSPGIVRLQRDGWFLAGVIDGAGSWGWGVEAADWSLARLSEAWSRGPMDPKRIATDVRKVARSLPVQFQEPDLGPPGFSVALVLVTGAECVAVAAGCYGVVLVDRGGRRDLFRPPVWTDPYVEDGTLGPDAARTHPLRDVLIGGCVADGRDGDLATSDPLKVQPDAALVIAEHRNLDLLGASLPSGPSPARAVQALLARPRLPVVVIEA